MKFSEFLIAAIRRSEIPLRFEPGAEEAVAKPVKELVRAWLEAHIPQEIDSDLYRGQASLIARLIAEVDDEVELPA